LRAFPKIENVSLTLIQGNECFVLKQKYENANLIISIAIWVSFKEVDYAEHDGDISLKFLLRDSTNF
jgi:hypothetical protein